MFIILARTLTIAATLLGLFAMAAISFTLYLGHRLLHSVKGPPYPSPPKVPPVCNLDHIEGVTTTDVIPGARMIKLFQVILDEGIVCLVLCFLISLFNMDTFVIINQKMKKKLINKAGNILISLHDNLDIKDVHVTKTYKFSDPSIEKHLDEVEFAFLFADPPRYTLHPVLNYGLDERRRLFYDGHDCANIDVQITFPRGYGFDHLELDTRYRGNINIQMQGYSDNDSFNTFKARAAYGDITVNGTNALEMTLQAPAGSIDALILADMHLTTYSAEDTVIEYIGLGLFVDALVVSEKRAIVVRKTHIFVLLLYYSLY